MKRYEVTTDIAWREHVEEDPQGRFALYDEAAAELARAADKLDAAYREIRERAGEAVDLAAKLEGLGVLYAELDAKCDAQAAVIERVRDLYDALPQYPEREALLEFAERTIETLAAASEHTGDKANAKYVDARDRCIAAQDESVALRAEVERLRDALQWVVNTLDEDYPMTASQIRKVLSTAPAPTGREAAERKVLDLVLKTVQAGHLLKGSAQRAICEAVSELAAVKS